MQFKTETTYPGSLDLVYEVLTSKELASARSKAVKTEIDFTETEAGHTYEAAVDTSGLNIPQPFAKFFDRFAVRAVGTTSPNRISYDITCDGAPVSGRIDIALRASGEQTRAEISGEIKVNIMLVGSRVERAAVEHIDTGIEADKSVVAAEIARRAGQ